MKFTKVLLAVAIVATVGFVSCKPKDADIQKSLQGKEVSGVTVAVADGVATLTGEVADDAAKAKAETTAKDEKGVKSVVNNLTITPPPVVVAPPVIVADDPLTKGVTDATKDYPGVKADVKDGVITLTGEITTDKWKKLKPALDALHPKKVDPKGLTIK